jgi:hypothetical protein
LWKMSSKKNISVINSFLWKTKSLKNQKKSKKKLPQLQQTIWKDVSVFILSYFKYRQIWLNMPVDYQHLSNITKLVF